MKLNIGASVPRGDYKRASIWVNTDIIRTRNMNVLGRWECLPFKDEAFDEIHAVHVLEHLRRDMPPLVLSESYRVLQKGCPIYVETPDFQETVRLLHHAFVHGDKRRIHIMTTSCYGKSERLGMEHYWGYTEDTLRSLLEGAGFHDVTRQTEMISDHYGQEPVVLMRGVK